MLDITFVLTSRGLILASKSSVVTAGTTTQN